MTVASDTTVVLFAGGAAASSRSNPASSRTFPASAWKFRDSRLKTWAYLPDESTNMPRCLAATTRSRNHYNFTVPEPPPSAFSLDEPGLLGFDLAARTGDRAGNTAVVVGGGGPGRRSPPSSSAKSSPPVICPGRRQPAHRRSRRTAPRHGGSSRYRCHPSAASPSRKSSSRSAAENIKRVTVREDGR